MFSLKSFVLLALLASVSANRDLLQGEFLFQFFQFFFRVRRGLFFGAGVVDFGDPLTPFLCLSMPDPSPETEFS